MIPRVPAAALIATLVLSGCEFERLDTTEFKPDGNRFSFEAYGMPAYPEDSERAEAMRMQWLRAWLDGAGMCASGFTIDSRQAVRLTAGGAFRIYYEGRCAS